MRDLSWLTARPIAHRGLHDLNSACWENTLSAFQNAVDAGYAIECDVHLAADGVPVVFHDSHLMRLTGMEGAVWERTSKELGKIPIGDTRDRIPTLAQMLELVSGQVPVVIELKGVHGHDAALAGAVAAHLRRYAGQAVLMSFNHWLLRDALREAPDIPRGLTACGIEDKDLEAHFSTLGYDLSFVSFAVADLPNRFVSFVRDKLAMPVITWTVRDEAGMMTTQRYADQITFEGFEPRA